jgi:hypothetical protein
MSSCPLFLALEAPEDHTLGEYLLRQEEKDDGGNDYHNRGSHDQVGIGRVQSIECL